MYVSVFILDASYTDKVMKNLYLVSIGTIIGHSCCTALAVIGGRYVSTKISPKHGAFLLPPPTFVVSPPSVTIVEISIAESNRCFCLFPQ